MTPVLLTRLYLLKPKLVFYAIPAGHVLNASGEADPKSLCNEQTQAYGSNPKSGELCAVIVYH